MPRKDTIPLTVLTRASFVSFLAALALVGAAFFQSPAPAQTPAPSQPAPDGLDFSAAQKAKADARQAQFRKDVEALQADTKLTPAQKQAKFAALFQSMNTDMMAILTPSQRSKVLKERQIGAQYRADMLALQANKTLTVAQKKARSVQIVQNARNATLALLPPAQRAAMMQRFAAVEQAQQAQADKIAEVRKLSQQLQKSETPAQAQKIAAVMLTMRTAAQSVFADKLLSSQAKAAKITALRQDAVSRDMALLTPAQRTLYERIQALVTVPH